MKKEFKEWLRELPSNLDTVVALLLAIVVTILGLLSDVDFKVITTCIVALLGILSFGFLKNQIKFDQTQKQINELIKSTKGYVADNLFSTGTDEKEIISGSDKTLLFIQETGSIITEKNRSEIMTFLSKGGNIKIVVALPDRRTSEYMAFRNANIGTQSIMYRGENFLAQIKNIAQNVNRHVMRLEVRYFPYPMGITAVIADPEDPVRKKRRALIRLADFNAPFEEKLDFQIDGNESDKTFNYYYNQFKYMSLNSHKIILLTGEPRSGKSTIFGELIHASSGNKNIFYVLSQEIKENDVRVGFEVITSDMESPVKFASRNASGTYDTELEIWEEIAEKLSNSVPKIIVLDEIGPIQIQSTAFKNALIRLFDMPGTTIYATIALQNDDKGFIENLKLHNRTTNFELNASNRGNLLNSLKDELKGSIKLYETLYNER